MSFLHDVGTCAIGLMVIFIIFGDEEVSDKLPSPWIALRVSTTVAGGLRGLAHTAKSCVGGLSQVWNCCGGYKRPARVSGVCPPNGRRRRRHLEGGNGRVGFTRMGSCCGFGPDVAPMCSYGLT